MIVDCPVGVDCEIPPPPPPPPPEHGLPSFTRTGTATRLGELDDLKKKITNEINETKTKTN